MTTTAEARFTEIEQTWFDADEHYYDDMRRTRSANQALAVELNWSNARAAYYRALADGLTRNNAEADAAHAALEQANRTVMQARAESERFGNLLDLLKDASGAAMRLVLLAA